MNEHLKRVHEILKQAYALRSRRMSTNTPHPLRPGLTAAIANDLIDAIDILTFEIERLDTALEDLKTCYQQHMNRQHDPLREFFNGL